MLYNPCGSAQRCCKAIRKLLSLGKTELTFNDMIHYGHSGKSTSNKDIAWLAERGLIMRSAGAVPARYTLNIAEVTDETLMTITPMDGAIRCARELLSAKRTISSERMLTGLGMLQKEGLTVFTPSDWARLAGISIKIACYDMQQLIHAGVLYRDGSGRNIRYGFVSNSSASLSVKAMVIKQPPAVGSHRAPHQSKPQTLDELRVSTVACDIRLYTGYLRMSESERKTFGVIDWRILMQISEERARNDVYRLLDMGIVKRVSVAHKQGWQYAFAEPQSQGQKSPFIEQPFPFAAAV